MASFITRYRGTDSEVPDDETEASTNGPYDLGNVMRDDPSGTYQETPEEDAYVSTIVPEYVTTLKSVHDSLDSTL